MAEFNPVAKLSSLGEKVSLRAHINAKCAECMGCSHDHMEPGFRDDIRGCTAELCPLWPVRPYQEIKKRKRAA